MNDSDECLVTIADEISPLGRRRGTIKCPECGAEQSMSLVGELTAEKVKDRNRIEAKDVQLLHPWACEHIQEYMESRAKQRADLNISRCEKCGKPNATFLSIHGLLCEDCDKKKEVVCDFCSAPDPPWVYPTKDFTMFPFAPSRSVKGWAACGECKSLIDANQKKELNQRAADSYVQHKIKERTDEDVERLKAMMKQMHIKFHANRHGPAIPIAEADKLVPPPPMKRMPEGTAQYMAALEKRLEWAQWAELRGQIAWRDYGLEKLALFKYTLDHGETYYMDSHFCELVDGARQSIPGEMEFCRDWTLSPYGWMWLAKPFTVPDIEDQESLEQNKNPLKNATMTVSAIGWRKINEDEIVKKPHTGEEYVAGADRYWFCCFVDHNRIFERDDPWKDDPNIPKAGERAGFGAWSFFTIGHGQKLLPRIEEFEGDQKQHFRGGDLGWYTKNPDRKYDLLHEIRWIFTAFYMMSQRLATRARHHTSRLTKRRLERINQSPPPWIEIVTLRRKQMARDEESKKGSLPVDWQWRWSVTGHWRQQWYPSEGVHKPKFIETFFKGPEDKPIKPVSTKIFVAER